MPARQELVAIARECGHGSTRRGTGRAMKNLEREIMPYPLREKFLTLKQEVKPWPQYFNGRILRS
ncbi:MAG: hypothetical protein GX044_03710 [Firmicutes bacterium]|nr:hypothetical protein [Bacillota bacterium]